MKTKTAKIIIKGGCAEVASCPDGVEVQVADYDCGETHTYNAPAKINSLGTILEQMELIAVDTRKEFFYCKETGIWSWYNRGEAPDYHGGFTTRFDALVDATEPYME